MKNYTIYMHKLRKDNRVYIGITCQNLKKRWQRGLGYIRSSYFYNAIKKYGWDNFEHIVLFENLTKEEAENLEIELISKFNSNKKGYGFNINSGGFAPTMTEEQKRKISLSEKGKVIKRETVEKANKTKRERYAKYGLTEKELERYKKRTKTILCIETNKTYYGTKELKKNGFNVTGVYQVCNNKQKTANGYHWKYIGETI